MKHIDAIYWITLRHRKDRQIGFGRNLCEFEHAPLHRINGINARMLAITTNRAFKVQCLTDGYVGSYLSHLMVMKIIAGLPRHQRILVMEDDTIVEPNFESRLGEALKGIPADWDMVHLGGYKDDGCLEDGCWAYLITPAGAQKFERILEQRHMHLDDTFKWARDRRQIKFHHTPNALVKHDYVTHKSDTYDTVEMGQAAIERESQPKVSYSQYREDVFVDAFFKGEKGRFLEIGALDGIKDSNCRLLALNGWKGVCIEANPYLFCQLHSNYINATNIETVCGLVMDQHGLRTLHMNSDGLATTDPKAFAELHSRVNFTGFCRLPVITPQDLLGLYGATFDFVSVDAEGVDTLIVKASKELFAGTKLLCVETDRPGEAHDAAYQSQWREALEEVGLTKVVHQTAGNTLLARP